MAEEPLKRIGDYEIIRELGHGGMGQVYLVRNVMSDRIEAMKVLLPDLAQQGESGQSLHARDQGAGQPRPSQHRALRTAFTADNQLVMIMEYVEGDTLADRLQHGPFSTADALNYIDQVLAALSYAHGKHVIHRDIKPANMMLTPQGVVKLMDFGIARSSTDLGLTVTGTTLGSLDYMSPEQVKSEPTDARSDLYSVGVSLYEMVTGQRMFGATSSYSVMEAHVKETPRPPIEVQPTLPRPLSDLIMMAVAKDPTQRFQTADAFRNAVAQMRGASAVAAPEKMVAPSQIGAAAASAPAAVAAAPVSDANLSPVASAQPVRASRHVGWLMAAAILVLVAIFGGTEVYRSHKQSDAGEGMSAPSSQGAAAPSPATTGATAQPQPPTATSPPGSEASAVPAKELTPSAKAHPAMEKAAAPQPQGSSEAELEQQQALAEQKKLLDAMETESDQLANRQASVESSLNTLEQQMHQSGLGLRGDMVSARASMRNDMDRAKQALDAADTERARHYLDLANRDIEKLEGFLGRR